MRSLKRSTGLMPLANDKRPAIDSSGKDNYDDGRE